MKLVITPTAEAQIDHQLADGITRHGPVTAAKTFARIDRFFTTTLITHPGAGTFIPERGLYQWPISRTPFIVIYRIEPEAKIVRVLGFFHHAQDRGVCEPNEH